MIQGNEPFAGIDHEKNYARGLDRRLDLLFDQVGQVVGVVDAHAAGVNQFGEAVADFD